MTAGSGAHHRHRKFETRSQRDATAIAAADADLEASVEKVEGVVHTTANFMHVASGILTGGCTYLYVSLQNGGFVQSLLLSALVGLMTMGALITFTSAAIRILPRLDKRFHLAGFLMAMLALVAVLTVSGTSNGTFLAFQEASSMHREKLIASAEESFTAAQNSIRKLEQILPILRTGKETARRLKEFEVDTGSTGSGKGPIYQELLVQETRLSGTAAGIDKVIQDAEHKIRSGQKILAAIREAQTDPALTQSHRLRLLENGLTRLGSIVIELTQQMPISSLEATAEMLGTPITLSTYSTDPRKRRMQDDTIARLHKEFEPIGQSLREAVTGLAERLPGKVPTYNHMSPTAVVFAHASELFWVLAVGYALDILPFMAIGLILLARKQLDGNRESTGAHVRRRRRYEGRD